MKRVIIYDFGRGGKVSTFIEKLYVSIFFFLSFLFSRTRDFFTGNFFPLGLKLFHSPTSYLVSICKINVY